MSHAPATRAQVEALERKYEEHDEEIQVIFQAIKQLLTATGSAHRAVTGHAAPGALLC
jgi:hypothetical protein